MLPASIHSDCILLVGNHRIEINKAVGFRYFLNFYYCLTKPFQVLAEASAYFKVLLNGNFKEKYEDEIELKGVHPEVFFLMYNILFPCSEVQITGNITYRLVEITFITFTLENRISPIFKISIDFVVLSTSF